MLSGLIALCAYLYPALARHWLLNNAMMVSASSRPAEILGSITLLFSTSQKVLYLNDDWRIDC